MYLVLLLPGVEFINSNCCLSMLVGERLAPLVGGRGNQGGYPYSPPPLPFSPLFQNPTVMPKINVPPTMLAEIKEAMMSAGEEILQSRSAECTVFGELSTDPRYTVKGTSLGMWLS